VDSLHVSVSYVTPISRNVTFKLSVEGSHQLCGRDSVGYIWGNRRKLV
jgi:hypothetical protein